MHIGYNTNTPPPSEGVGGGSFSRIEGGRKTCPIFKRGGGGHDKFYPVLRGGGGAQKVSDPRFSNL